MDTDKMWNREQAIELCTQIESLCPRAGCHVALTGGVLYKKGHRKDLDLLFYRIRQQTEIDMTRLWSLLMNIGMEKKSGFGWVYKCTYQDKPIDCFFPEEEEGDDEYPEKPITVTTAIRQGLLQRADEDLGWHPVRALAASLLLPPAPT